LTLTRVILDIAPDYLDAHWLAARLCAQTRDRGGVTAALTAMHRLDPDEPRAVLATLLNGLADGSLATPFAAVDEAMCRNVDIGETLFSCCLRLVDAEDAVERAYGTMLPLGNGWPVAASPTLLAAVKALYLHLPRVFNSTHFTDRYFVDQATFMRYNGDRLRALVAYVTHAVRVPPKGRVLDAGCGNGFLLQSLVSAYGVQPWGQDNSASLRAIVEANVPGIQFHVGELTSLPHPDGFFDLVVSTDVIEHLDAPGQAVAELVRVTRPGGEVFVSVPDGRRDQGSGHINFFGPEGFERLCRAWRHDPVQLHKGGLSVVIRP
jgi:2-polyprenyl-3-methyl-5-hydroxy-6-metoxy-1,4-benzoquinol methylase